MSVPLRVLILSEQPLEAERLAAALDRAGLDITWTRAASESDFLHSLHPPLDLVLSARAVDGLDAASALRRMRQEGQLLPFIVVDPAPEDGLAAAVLQEGALACVPPEALADCIREALGRVAPDRIEGLNPADVDLLAEIVHHSMEGIVIEDADGRMVFVNPAAAELLGYTRQELTGRHWTLIIPTDQQEVVRTADSRRAEGRADRYVLELLRRDGRRVTVLVSGSPRVSHGRFGGSVAVFTDIGGLKQTEEALRASNDTLRAMIEASPLAIMVLEPDGTVRMWNAAAERTFGWREAEILGRFNPLVPSDRLDEHRRLRERAMSGEHLDGIEVVRQRKDGSPIDIRLSTAPIRNASGEVTGILGIMADITAAKKTEAALRESEEKFRGLAEESPNMIFINQGGRVVYANPQAALVMGYSREELCDPAFDFMRLIDPDSRDLIHSNLERHRRGEDIPPYTYVLTARDGRRIEAIHTTRLIRYGGAPAILGIVTDITDQRRVEASLARRASQLEALSEIGTRIASVTELKELLERAAALVGERFGYEHVGIFLRRDGELEMAARSGIAADLFPGNHRVPLGRGMVGTAAARGEMLLANDVDIEPIYVNYFPGRVQTRSELSLPIRSGGTTVGVLDVQSTHVGAFGENDVLVLGILSDQLGAAVADVRLYEALRASEERYRALTENAAVGIYRTTPDGEILFANPAAVRMLGFASFQDLADRNLEHEGFSPIYPRSAFRERLEREGEIIGMEAAWARRDGSMIYVRENARVIRDSAGRPLYYEGTVEDITDRKRAEEALERHAGELQALYETSLEIGRQADVDALLRTIIERAARLVGTNSGGLYLVRPGRQSLEMVVSYNLPHDFVGVNLAMGDGLSGKVALTGQPLAIADYSSWAGRSSVYDGYHFGRVLGVPMRRGPDILGVIVITDPTTSGDFTPEEVRLVSLFADQAALALDNARLLEAERARLAELARAHQLMTGLSRVAARLERTHDPEQVLITLREHLLPLGVNFWMAVLDPPTGDLLVRYATPEAGVLAPIEKALGISVRGYRIPRVNLSFYDQLFVERRPVLRDSIPLVREIAPFIPGPMVEKVLQVTGIGPDTKTICLPLESESGVLGGLFLWGDSLNEGAMESYAVFASQVAVAFEQARLLESERQRSAALAHSHGLLAALSQVAASIERSEDPDEFLESLGNELRGIGLGCGLATIDPEAESFILRYLSVGPEVMAQMEKLITSPLIGWTVPGKRMPIYNHLVRERRTIMKGSTEIVRQVWPRLPKRAVDILLRVTGASDSTRTFGIPLVSRELVTAVLFVWGEGLEESDMGSYAAFGSQVAVALEKARLIDDMRQHATYLGAVVKVAGALRVATSREEMLPILLDQLLELMQAEGTAIEALQPSGLEVRTELARGVWADWTGRVRGAREGVRGHVLHLRQPYLTEHAPADSLFHRRDDLAGARAVACVPLVSQEQTLGLLWAGRRAPFTDPETRIIMAVADMAASAIHRVGVMETLEEHVQQRTHALEEANLQLQELDKMKSDFVSNVSHELRTPIANILLYLDLLGDIARENRRGEYQAILRREAERLARLIEDLLTLSRLERDRVQLNFEAHPLDPILGEVAAAQRARAEAKGIRLIHEPDPDLPAAWVSREQIVQVFTNLVSNAVAYTPEGGTVLVSTRETRVRGRRHVVGRVHNSGPPIPPEDLPHIFERFYRGRTARFSGEPGTGLGLAISKDIVERHHGWIEVESNASVGTTFSVWLPVSPP